MAPRPADCLKFFKYSCLLSPPTNIRLLSSTFGPISLSSPFPQHPISAMEAASTKFFVKSNPHFNSIVLRRCHPLKLSPNPSSLLPLLSFRHRTTLPILSLLNPNSHPPNWNPSLLYRSVFQSNINSPISSKRFARILSGHNGKSFEWKFAVDGVNGRELGFAREDKPAVTVVLLGWLGSKQKHLRRYAELYNLYGMNSVTFAASVTDVLGFDLGRRLEARIEVLTNELVSWLSESDKDGRERFLIFHTFSNTGWLAYGSILNILQGRQELVDKIKGCVVDSGGDGELDPKVWAAGFTTAMLKKYSSSANTSFEPGKSNSVPNGEIGRNTKEKEPLLIEVFLLSVFEKLFSYLLDLPDINKKMMKIIYTLSDNQPPHLQLYLYSTADKVIPYQKIESFIEYQRRLGRKVKAFNFKSTPHVDHYRTFPDKYQSLIQNFLKECFAEVKQV